MFAVHGRDGIKCVNGVLHIFEFGIRQKKLPCYTIQHAMKSTATSVTFDYPLCLSI